MHCLGLNQLKASDSDAAGVPGACPTPPPPPSTRYAEYNTMHIDARTYTKFLSVTDTSLTHTLDIRVDSTRHRDLIWQWQALTVITTTPAVNCASAQQCAGVFSACHHSQDVGQLRHQRGCVVLPAARSSSKLACKCVCRYHPCFWGPYIQQMDGPVGSVHGSVCRSLRVKYGTVIRPCTDRVCTLVRGPYTRARYNAPFATRDVHDGGKLQWHDMQQTSRPSDSPASDRRAVGMRQHHDSTFCSSIHSPQLLRPQQ